jgi:type IV pilus assembly protein PilF
MKNIIFLILVLLPLVSCSSRKEKSIESKKADLYYGQGTNLLRSKDYTKALKNLIASNKYRPNDTKTLNNLGMAYYFKKSEASAIRYITKAIEIDPTNSDARMNIATIYLKQGKLDQAEKQYKLILKDLVYENQYITYYNLASIELMRSNKEKAKTLLNESVAVNENYCPAFYKLGKLSFDEGNYKYAKKMFKEASMGLCYKIPEPQYYMALSLIKLNEYFEAEQVLESMMENFALTKWESTAQNEILRLKKINSLENSDLLQAKKSKRKFFTPDF